MSLLLYVAVLLVSLSSVLLGLGWLSAPEPHYPAVVAAPATPAPKSAANASPSHPAAPTQPAVAAAVEQSTAPAKPVDAANAAAPSAEAAATPAPTDMPPAPIVAATPAPPACDIEACTRAYRSFRVSDCTYQPNYGPRRLCTKGTPPAKPTAAAPPLGAEAQARVSSCNFAACTAAYRTFDPTDCTYQPTEGPRRLCAK
jgi:hypothetical protein